MRPADFRLPMEAAAARMERGLRAGGQRQGIAAAATADPNTEPMGIFPERPRASESEVLDDESTRRNGASQPHGPTGE
jgi:hypothetical protein